MAVYVFVWRGNLTIQHKYKNCYFFRKSSGIMYLALAVAPATWYNNIVSVFTLFKLKEFARGNCYD